jgi:hypothetical protein
MESPRPRDERKLVTVVFADLAGSTELTARHDLSFAKISSHSVEDDLCSGGRPRARPGTLDSGRR